MNGPADGPGPEESAAGGGVLSALSSGVFLACSWTWCIGMFLPALLIGDFGWPAWVVFAIPNIVGAAAMGVVLRDRGPAAALRERHLPAAVCFSWVTIAFHVFFLTWVAAEWLTLPVLRFRAAPPDASALQETLLATIEFVATAMANPAVTAGVFVGVVYLAALVFSRSTFAGLRRVAWVVWIASLTLIGSWLLRFPPDALPQDAAMLPAARGVSHWTGLLFLAPVCVFGFALCPYLDLTFLRARMETPGRSGSAAFVIGFGGFFLVMIVGTLLYATGIVRYWHLAGALIAHVAMQSVFTLAAHLRELRLAAWPKPAVLRRAGALAPLGAFVIPLLLYESMGNGDAYRVFMGAYGLVFPAYLWIAGAAGDRRRTGLVIFALACALAGPLYWLGFVEREWWALGPGLGIAIVGGGVALAARRVT